MTLIDPTVPNSGRAKEMRDLIQTTMDLIEESGTYIQLHRKSESEPDGAGGRLAPDTDSTALPVVKRFFGPLLYEPLELTSNDGYANHDKIVLIGLPGDDIQKGDWFLYLGQRYDIHRIQPNNGYMVKGEGEVTSDGRSI